MNATAEQPAAATPPVPGSRAARHVARQKIAFNFILLAAGEFVAKLLTFGAFARLARVLQPERYGMIEFTLAMMIFFSLPVDLGLGSYGAREIARNRNNAPKLLREITSLRLLLAAISFTALMLTVVLIHKSVELKMLLGLYGISLLAGPALLQWFFQAHDLMHWVAIASIVRQVVFAGLVLLFAQGNMRLVTMGVIECVSAAAVGVYCLAVIRRLGYDLPIPTLRLKVLAPHLRESWPIGLTELAWAFMWYFATVLLGFWFEDESLGWFGASHRILMALHTFVWLYFFNLLPSISRSVNEKPEYLRDLMSQSLRFTVWVGVLGAFGLTILSREVLTLLYGPGFAGSVPSFSVLIWMLPVALLSGHYRYTLLAYNHQRVLLLCTAASAVAAVLLGATLVPIAGATGAAWALLLANVLNLVLVYYSVQRRVLALSFQQQALEAVGAMLAALGVFFVFVWLNTWVAAMFSFVTYAGALVLARGKGAFSIYKLITRRMPA